MKKLYTLFLVATFCGFTQAQNTLTQWNFDSSSTAPSAGSGTLSLIGGTTPYTPAYETGQAGLCYSATAFPGSSSNSGTAGYRFNTSTSGYNGISVSFHVNGHNQSSRWLQYEYSTDGGNTWTVISNNGGDLTTSFALKTVVLPATCDNQPNFAFRVVSIFQPSTSSYQSIQGGGYNGNNGRWRIDNVTFSYNTLSTNENKITGLKLYPNPVKNTLFVTTDSFATKQIELFDILGKSVLNAKVINNTVNVSALSKGIYIAKITEGGKTVTRKIIID